MNDRSTVISLYLKRYIHSLTLTGIGWASTLLQSLSCTFMLLQMKCNSMRVPMNRGEQNVKKFCRENTTTRAHSDVSGRFNESYACSERGRKI